MTQIFNLTNFSAGSVTPWITSSNLSLASQPAVGVTNGSFTYALPAMSVITFVGQGYVPPSSITISSASFNPGGPAFVLTWNSTAGATYSVFKTNVLGGAVASLAGDGNGLSCGGSDRRPAFIHGHNGHRQPGLLPGEQSVIRLESRAQRIAVND